MVQNLSPEIDSNKLFTHFSRVSHDIFSVYSTIFVTTSVQFGQIVRYSGSSDFSLNCYSRGSESARVMRDEKGGSRGFGFVSYHEPEHGKLYFTCSIFKSIFFLKLLRLCLL